MAWDRGSSARRGYGHDWRKARGAILKDNPLCRACFGRGYITPATQVDHIVPKAKGGTDERSNLQPLCARCHADKTQVESSGKEWDGTVKGCDAQGNPLAAPKHWR